MLTADDIINSKILIDTPKRKLDVLDQLYQLRLA